MAAEWIKFGEPENESELAAIRYLCGHLPDSYKLYTNLEISQGGRLYEIDIILVAPHGVYVVDVKGVYGRLEVDRAKWYPENRQAYDSPLKKYRQHARVLKSLIKDYDRFRQDDLDKIWVQATVLLTVEDVIVEDVSYEGTEAKDITYLGKSCLKYFQDWQKLDDYFITKIKPFHSLIDRAIHGRSKPISKIKRYGSWEVIETLGEAEDRYVEYLAKKVSIGIRNHTARLRVYKVDPLLDAEERQAAYKLISTAFQAVYDLPRHDNILDVQDIDLTEDADSLFLVIDDIHGQPLRQHIKKQDLTLDQIFNLLAEVLRALDHAHKHGVIHRNITPETILVTTEKQAKLTGFDYARITGGTGTIADQIVDALEAGILYQDVDCQRNPAQASPQSDLFAVGHVFYELLMGQPAFTDPDDMYEANGIFPVPPSQKHTRLPKGFDSWLQKLCAFDRRDRFTTAREALDQLTPLSKPTLDLSNLPNGTVLDNQFKIIQRLGLGSFAVAYKVFEIFSEDFQVMKIAVRDDRSLFERVQQEFKILYNTLKNPHPNIVTARWAGQLKEHDNTPYILFEFVEGQPIEQLLGTFSLDEAVQIIKQTAEGLRYLHQQDIQHQDIKPANLLHTAQGVKIIDFNVAVSKTDESAITAGTRRYLPPGFKVSATPSVRDRVDRDLYALGITAYQCITGHYPFDDPQPVIGQCCKDPRQFEGCEDLSDEMVEFLQRAIAPQQSERFESAEALLTALNSISSVKVVHTTQTEEQPLQLAETIQQPEDCSTENDLLEKVQEFVHITTPEQPKPLKLSQQPIASINPPPIFPAISGIASATPQPATTFSKFDLFELPSSHQQVRPNPDHPIVLDPSGAYPVPTGYILIKTELDWMSYFGTSNSPYWVSGQTLCNWANLWLQSWHHTDQIAEIKQPPKERLTELLYPSKVPEEWTESQCLAVVMRLESYEDQPIAHLLADLTATDPQIWLDVPSLDNLARWLPIQVPPVATVLEQVWQNHRSNNEWSSYYQTSDKQQLLKRWLGIAEPVVTELGAYPLDIPAEIVAEFDQFWEQELYRTNAAVLDSLKLSQYAGQKRIADLAYSIMRQHPAFITKTRETKLRPYLSYQQYGDLQQRHRPLQPNPLSLDASPQDALNWVIQDYLPLRHWETVIDQTPQGQRVSDQLAISFEDWILEHYPTLKVDAVANSWLNYNVCHHAQQCCRNAPVFWVVVDGLGWLDHHELITYLTEHKQLQVEVEMQPRFSILPTKTEYAKWSLYSQQLPSHESRLATSQAGDGFTLTNARRYTDNDVKKKRLQKDLKQQAFQLYCWDTDRFDHLYHDEVDWQELYTVKRSRELKHIAEDILRFVEIHPQKDNLTVIIASDHGQIMGTSTQLTPIPSSLSEAKGRMAIGETDDQRFAVLMAERYGLPHPISVIRGSASFSSFNYGDDKSSVGCHGGLYPEEVVVGFSVLKRSVQRLPIRVICSGEGKAGEPGKLTITITNPNSVSLTNLKLFIQQLDSLKQGQELSAIVQASGSLSVDIQLSNYPTLSPSHQGNCLSLTGQLEFNYQNAEPSSVCLDQKSKIVIKQIFSSGIEGLDEFF